MIDWRKIMDIKINNIKDILSPFNEKKLNEEFESYLLKECELNLKDTLTLTIVSNLKKKEQDEIEKVIHNHFFVYYEKWQKIDQLDNYFRILLLVLGIIFILISEQLNAVFRELFLIAGWVVVWEIIYDELFSQIKRKQKKKIYKNLASCKIIFIKE